MHCRELTFSQLLENRLSCRRGWPLLPGRHARASNHGTPDHACQESHAQDLSRPTRPGCTVTPEMGKGLGDGVVPDDDHGAAHPLHALHMIATTGVAQVQGYWLYSDSSAPRHSRMAFNCSPQPSSPCGWASNSWRRTPRNAPAARANPARTPIVAPAAFGEIPAGCTEWPTAAANSECPASSPP